MRSGGCAFHKGQVSGGAQGACLVERLAGFEASKDHVLDPADRCVERVDERLK
jgi:hypothetical protein